MFNKPYGNLCNHNRFKRIDDNFVRCLDCGQSMISQKILEGNKKRNDFTKENKSFNRNFDRNFSNELDEVDELSSRPIYEYYTDRMGANKIIINKQLMFSSNPPKYKVTVNGSDNYLTQQEIHQMLWDINAIRIK